MRRNLGARVEGCLVLGGGKRGGLAGWDGPSLLPTSWDSPPLPGASPLTSLPVLLSA